MNDDIRLSRSEALWMADRMIELAYRNETLAEQLEERLGGSDSHTERLRERAMECRSMLSKIESRLDFDIKATWN